MIPVTILSGFLGAGKTTFLNSLIASMRASGRRPLVIENEYGQENIDSQLVVGAEGGDHSRTWHRQKDHRAIGLALPGYDAGTTLVGKRRQNQPDRIYRQTFAGSRV